MDFLSSDAATYLAKSSPFAFFCILLLAIQYFTYRSFTKRQIENFKLALEAIQSNYEKSLEIIAKTQDPGLINKVKGKK